MTASEYTVRFGRTAQQLRLPAQFSAIPIVPRTPPPGAPPTELLRHALQKPIASPPLRELARGRRTAAILVPGQDRVAAADIYLPALLDELNAAGIADSEITAYLATGTHAKHSAAQIEQVLGREAAARVRCQEHDCQDPGALRFVGQTASGNQVRFNAAVVDAGIKVLTGRIIPHYFAGFGGGRKALLPGVAAFETIVHNHRLTLAAELGIRPETHACRLSDNPVHLDMLESARLMPGPKFVLNTLLDTRHRLIAAVAGELEAAHLEGCRQAAHMFAIPFSETCDAAIACAGGHPYDWNFMQAIKAMFDVCDVVRAGGAILCIAQCPAGIQPGFLEWAAIDDDAELNRAVRANYNLTGHNSILIRNLVRQRRIALWSDLPDSTVQALGIQPVHSLEQGMEWLGSAVPQGGRCAVAPFANVSCAVAAENDKPKGGKP